MVDVLELLSRSTTEYDILLQAVAAVVFAMFLGWKFPSWSTDR